MKRYDHKAVEKKWQAAWERQGLYTTPDDAKGKRENFYLLTEFPYPSGNLHVGHWYAFSVPDIFARYMRMHGKNVLYPIGFDAFGLPAENAAIKNKLNPREWTYGNIERMREQIRSMGASFDWSREVVTCDPEYYRWTQWLFLQFFNKGLAYRKMTPANWCPSCRTVLANEQVENGRCERCKTEVVQKEMLQWNLRITDYADRLHDDLEKLDWPEPIKEAQRAWIGRSEGAVLEFQIAGAGESKKSAAHAQKVAQTVEVFTTRPDTLFGATYLVLAPEHPFLESVRQKAEGTGNIENWEEVEKYITLARKKTELERQEGREKTGVELRGIRAVHPATGEEMPVWVADYVLAQYGTGAIMAVPAHDERDYAFAKKFNLPVRRVIEPVFYGDTGEGAVRPGLPFVKREAICAVVRNPKDDTYLCNVWKGIEMRGLLTGGLDGGEDKVQAALREIREETGYTDVRLVSDPGWIINTFFYHRQKKENRWARFHILFFELESEEKEAVSEEEEAKYEFVWKRMDELRDFYTVYEGAFVATLLENPDYVFTGNGILGNSGTFDEMNSEEAKRVITERYGRPQKTYRLRDWLVSRQRYWGVPIPVIHCHECGMVPVPEELLPVVLPPVEEYLPDGEGKSPLAKVKEWYAVPCPECDGPAERETDTLDTFVDSSWYFLRYTDPKNEKEFAARKRQEKWMPVDLYSGGAEHTTMHLLYSRFWHKALFDLGLVGESEPYARRMNRSLIMGPDGQKMSKSRGNVVDPDEVVERLGADTVRMYLAFIGPYNEVSTYPWNPDGVVGVRRFLERVWKHGQEVVRRGQESVPELEGVLHKTIKKVGEDIAAQKFNTAISQLMIFLNATEKAGTVGTPQWRTFLKLLAPFAPHMAEELWQALGADGSVHLESWPAFEERYMRDERVTLAVQINGKVRAEIELDTDAPQEKAERAAREAVAERLEGKRVLRTIVVQNRLVNFVTED